MNLELVADDVIFKVTNHISSDMRGNYCVYSVAS